MIEYALDKLRAYGIGKSYQRLALKEQLTDYLARQKDLS